MKTPYIAKTLVNRPTKTVAAENAVLMDFNVSDEMSIFRVLDEEDLRHRGLSGYTSDLTAKQAGIDQSLPNDKIALLYLMAQAWDAVAFLDADPTCVREAMKAVPEYMAFEKNQDEKDFPPLHEFFQKL